MRLSVVLRACVVVCIGVVAVGGGDGVVIVVGRVVVVVGVGGVGCGCGGFRADAVGGVVAVVVV